MILQAGVGMKKILILIYFLGSYAHALRDENLGRQLAGSIWNKDVPLANKLLQQGACPDGAPGMYNG